MSYKPQKGSVSARVLPIMQAATVPMVSTDVAAILKKKGGKPVPISQVSQALFNLSEKGAVNRKRKPGKKKIFIYYPLKLPNPTAEPEVFVASEDEKLEAAKAIVLKATNNLVASEIGDDMLSALIDQLGHTPLVVLLHVANLDPDEIKFLAENW